MNERMRTKMIELADTMLENVADNIFNMMHSQDMTVGILAIRRGNYL